LEPYRNSIVILDSVLTWEKNYYPGVLFGTITAFFLILWQMDLSFITMAALTGLSVLAFDNIYPTLSRFAFNADAWNGEQEEQFDRVCQQVCSIQQIAVGWYEYLFCIKERKSTIVSIMI